MTTTLTPTTGAPSLATPTPATTFRVAAVAAVVATVIRIISIFTWPPNSDASHARMLATAGAHPTAWNLATWAEVICWLSAGFAVLVALWLVRGRGFWPTRIGGWVYGASLVTLAFIGGSQNAVTGVLAKQSDPASMVKVIDDLHSAGSLAPFVMLVLLGELFAIAFAVGLVRAGLVGWWYVAATVLAVVGYVVTSDSSNHLVVLAGFVPLALTWLYLAKVLTAPTVETTA